MKETLGSMRAYLILVGLVAGGQAILGLSGSEHVLVTIFLTIALVVAAAFVGVGIALLPVLRHGVVPFTIFIAGCLVWILFSFIVTLLFGQPQILNLVLGIPINLYLLANGRRLARELSGTRVETRAGNP